MPSRDISLISRLKSFIVAGQLRSNRSLLKEARLLAVRKQKRRRLRNWASCLICSISKKMRSWPSEVAPVPGIGVVKTQKAREAAGLDVSLPSLLTPSQMRKEGVKRRKLLGACLRQDRPENCQVSMRAIS